MNFKDGSVLKAKVYSRLLVFAVLLFALLFTFSCGDSASERAEKVGGVTAGQIIENPGAYVGKTVTVSGDVEEIYGPKAFSMDSGSSVGELLVVGREPFPQISEAENRAYVISDVATVTGVVQMLVTADIEREIGWDLTPEVEARYNAKPVLIAKTISFRPTASAGSTNSANATNVQPAVNANVSQLNGDQNLNTQADAENRNGDLNNTKGNQNPNQSGNTNAGMKSDQTTGGGNIITDVGAYGSANDKLSLVNKEAQFSNVRVNRVVGPRTFTIGSGKSELYVMLDDESARGVGTQGKIEVGDTFNIKGRFERLDAAEINNIASDRFRPLTDQERAFLKTTQVYLQSNEVNKVK